MSDEDSWKKLLVRLVIVEAVIIGVMAVVLFIEN